MSHEGELSRIDVLIGSAAFSKPREYGQIVRCVDGSEVQMVWQLGPDDKYLLAAILEQSEGALGGKSHLFNPNGLSWFAGLMNRGK